MSDFNAWLSSLAIDTPNARHIDDDADGSYDCVDVAEDWAKACFPGVPINELLGSGDAKDLYAASNEQYFDRLAPTITSLPGDIPVWGATSTNAYGHIAVTINDDGTSLTDVEQNTYTQEAPTIAHRSHNNIIGFLRPKIPQGEDMTVDDTLARRLLSLSTALLQDGNQDDRQPTLDEINTAIGRDANEYVDYLLNTQPIQANRAKVKFYAQDLAAKDAEINQLKAAPADQAAPQAVIGPVIDQPTAQRLLDFLKLIFIGKEK